MLRVTMNMLDDGYLELFFEIDGDAPHRETKDSSKKFTKVYTLKEILRFTHI
jgi:hypothetical protein